MICSWTVLKMIMGGSPVVGVTSKTMHVIPIRQKTSRDRTRSRAPKRHVKSRWGRRPAGSVLSSYALQYEHTSNRRQRPTIGKNQAGSNPRRETRQCLSGESLNSPGWVGTPTGPAWWQGSPSAGQMSTPVMPVAL